MKNQKKIGKIISPKEVIRQIRKATHQKVDETKAEEATIFYSEELFDYDFSDLENWTVDLSEFAGEI